jgi:large subunit ribosomal protein L24
VQNTLLGIGIALILALTSALVGPHFVNWSSYRSFFEAEATRLIGLPVQVNGAIDARLLPTPSVTLRAIAIGEGGEGGEAPRLRAAALSFQLGLGPLMRGDIKAVETRLIGPEFKLGLKYDGSVDWPGMSPQLSGDRVSIDRLTIEEGRAILTDAGSGARLVLEKLKFQGEARSLVGPVRGEGQFASGAEGYRYRISTGRYGADGMRLKLEVEPLGRPLNIEAEGTLAFDYGAPRFEGSISVMRPVGTVQTGGKVTVNEPWRATSKIKASVTGALFDQIDLRYGPEERAMILTGAAEAKFGAQTRLNGNLTARHVDLDRLTGTPGALPQPPLARIKAFADMFGTALTPTLPTLLTIKIDAVTVGGAMLQGVTCLLQSQRDGWALDPLEFRAPGFTHVRTSGHLSLTAGGVSYTGFAKINAADPVTLLSWLNGRGNPTPGLLRPWQAEGEITLTRERIAIAQLRTELDRATLRGQLLYAFPAGNRPARLQASVRANEIDLDAWLLLADSALAGASVERPQEVDLALEVERARFAGIDMRNAAARLKLDGDRLEIEKVSIESVGNAAIEIRGQIIAGDGLPRGEIDLNLDARELKGVLALADRFAPGLAKTLRRLGDESTAAQLRGKLGMEGSSPGARIKRTTARMRLDGQIGRFRLQLVGASTAGGAMSLRDFGNFANGELKFEGRLDTEDGAALLALFGLERAQGADKRPGRLTLLASGPLNSNFRIDARLIGGVFDLSGSGAANLTGERPAANFGRVSGVIGNSKVEGRLALVLDDAPRLDGSLNVDQVDAAVVLAALIGMPIERMTTMRGGTAIWSAEPFPSVLFGFTGRIEIIAARAKVHEQHIIQTLRGALQFTSSRVSFEIFDGHYAGGRVKGNLAVFSGLDGLSALVYLDLSNVRAADVVPAQGSAPVSGTLSIKTTVEGSGLSPASFMGSLQGNGELSLSDGEFAGLNPYVFDALTRVVDLGVRADPAQIRDFVAMLLANGVLKVPQAQSRILVVGGQARLVEPRVVSQDADLAVTGMIDVAQGNIDATLRLSGASAGDVAGRPAVTVVLKGPLTAPQRSVNADSLAGWLALRSVEQQSRRIEAIEATRRAALSQSLLEMPSISFTPATPARAEENAKPMADTAVPATASRPGEAAALDAGQAPPPLPPPIIISPDPAPTYRTRAAPKRGNAGPP